MTRAYKHWSPGEVVELSNLYTAGMNDNNIADQLDRSMWSVRSKRKNLGLLGKVGRPSKHIATHNVVGQHLNLEGFNTYQAIDDRTYYEDRDSVFFKYLVVVAGVVVAMLSALFFAL